MVTVKRRRLHFIALLAIVAVAAAVLSQLVLGSSDRVRIGNGSVSALARASTQADALPAKVLAYPFAVVEPADGNEQETLPDWWKEAVLVTDDPFVPTWIGKRVRPDQTAGFNLQGYRDVGEALVPP